MVFEILLKTMTLLISPNSVAAVGVLAVFNGPMEGETECVPLFLSTPIDDSRLDPRILSTKRPSNFGSSIGVSNSEVPKE